MIILLYKSLYLIFLYELFWSQHICNASHSSIIVDNGYKGVVIAISQEIGSNHKDIVDKTQELIKKSSQILYESTGNRAYFSEVTILVPNTWTDYPNDPNQAIVRYSDADIIVTEKGTDSFTLQFGGCSEAALPIVMSKEQVLGTNDKYGDSAKLLAHQWAQYRYGVFNEFGFPGDKLYPAFYSIPGSEGSDSDIRLTACADGQQIHYDTNSCSLKVNNETGLPSNEHCIPLPLKDNNTMKSSFMYSQALNSVNRFCGYESHVHNVNSPNKQNNLCNGRDTWSIIKTHLDSEGMTIKTTRMEPTIRVVRDEFIPKTLIAVANSAQMKTHNRGDWINLALLKYLRIDLPASQAALIEFNGDETNVKDNWKEASKLIYNIRFEGEAKPIDFENLLKKGKEKFSEVHSGGTFVIIIGGIRLKPSNAGQIEKVAKDLHSSNIRLKIIVYPVFVSRDDRIHASDLFKKAISITGGSVDYINEDQWSTKGCVSTLIQFFKAFQSVRKDFAGSNLRSYSLISEQIYKNPSQTINFKFNIDSTLVTTLGNRNLRIYFIQSESGVSGGFIKTVSLKDATGGSSYTTNNPDGLQLMMGYELPITSTTPIGEWELSAEIDGTGPDRSVAAIVEFESNLLETDAISAKCWLSSTVEHNPSSPLRVFVDVNHGISELIEDASVEVEVTYESPQNIPKYELIDDGLGSPDITKGDGIYSQYIIDIANQGYYFINAIVRNKNKNIIINKNFGTTSLPTNHDSKYCCGSKIDGGIGNEIEGNFTRTLNCGSIFVTSNWIKSQYPPNTIRDLRVEKADFYNRTISLLWTSTGGDYTSNRVNRYVIKAFHGSEDDPNLRTEIRNKFDDKVSAKFEVINNYMTGSVAERYGEEERTEIRIESEEGGSILYYIAIKAFDSEGHGSEVSNIVVAKIKSNVQITSPATLTSDVSKAPVVGSGGSAKFAGMEWWEILVISISCAVVLVFIIIIAICFAGKRRRKNDNENEKIEEQPPQRRAPDPPRISPPLFKTESIHENGSLNHSVEKIPNANFHIINTNSSNNSGSQQNLRELNVNALSPVQSWDAKDLLNHWGRVQEAKSRQEAPPVMRIEDIESASSNRTPSYASSEDDNTGVYTNPGTWRYQDVTAVPTYIPNPYQEPIYRTSLNPLRSNTPDSVPRYSTINRPKTTVSQV